MMSTPVQSEVITVLFMHLSLNCFIRYSPLHSLLSHALVFMDTFFSFRSLKIPNSSFYREFFVFVFAYALQLFRLLLISIFCCCRAFSFIAFDLVNPFYIHKFFRKNKTFSSVSISDHFYMKSCDHVTQFIDFSRIFFGLFYR